MKRAWGRSQGCTAVSEDWQIHSGLCSRVRLNYLTFHQTLSIPRKWSSLPCPLLLLGRFPSCPDYSAALTIYALECDDLFLSSLHMLEIRLLTAKKSIRYHLKLSVLSICDIRDTLKFIWIFNLTEHLDYFVGWGWSPNLVHARWMLWLAAALCASFAQLLR